MVPPRFAIGAAVLALGGTSALALGIPLGLGCGILLIGLIGIYAAYHQR